MQEIYEDVPEPDEDGTPVEHLCYVGARFCRWLMSWPGLAVWATVVVVAAVVDLLNGG